MTTSGKAGGMKPVLFLSAVLLVGWIACFWPARMLRGEVGVQWMSLAAIACLVPGWIVVVLSWLSVVRGDMAAMLLQTSVRLFSVASVALVVRKFWPKLGFIDFFGWLVLFYLLSMSVEVWLLRRSISRPQ